MVKRYDSYNYDPYRRKFKYLIKTPWWMLRYGQLLFLGGLVVPFVWLYGPPFWQFLFPSKLAIAHALNPRLVGSEREIRKRFERRDEDSNISSDN